MEIADLSARTKLRLTGADRVRYLNGQVTANVATLAPGRALPACVTTAKGKLCAVIFITAEAEALLLDAEPELRESLAARLEKYIVADDVALADVTDELALFHVLAGAPPASEGARIAAARRFGCEGWDVWREDLRRGAAATPDDGGVAATTLDDAALEARRIEAGLPRWGRELGPDTLPAEAGLDRTHVDFHKGCYIGQEVISRVESVGRVNRALVGYVATSGAPLVPGAQIFAGDERAVGEITSAAWSFALEKNIALGYHRRGAPGEGLVARSPGAADLPVALHPLPFVSA